MLVIIILFTACVGSAFESDLTEESKIIYVKSNLLGDLNQNEELIESKNEDEPYNNFLKELNSFNERSLKLALILYVGDYILSNNINSDEIEIVVDTNINIYVENVNSNFLYKNQIYQIIGKTLIIKNVEIFSQNALKFKMEWKYTSTNNVGEIKNDELVNYIWSEYQEVEIYDENNFSIKANYNNNSYDNYRVNSESNIEMKSCRYLSLEKKYIKTNILLEQDINSEKINFKFLLESFTKEIKKVDYGNGYLTNNQVYVESERNAINKSGLNNIYYQTLYKSKEKGEEILKSDIYRYENNKWSNVKENLDDAEENIDPYLRKNEIEEVENKNFINDAENYEDYVKFNFSGLKSNEKFKVYNKNIKDINTNVEEFLVGYAISNSKDEIFIDLFNFKNIVKNNNIYVFYNSIDKYGNDFRVFVGEYNFDESIYNFFNNKDIKYFDLGKVINVNLYELTVENLKLSGEYLLYSEEIDEEVLITDNTIPNMVGSGNLKEENKLLIKLWNFDSIIKGKYLYIYKENSEKKLEYINKIEITDEMLEFFK